MSKIAAIQIASANNQQHNLDKAFKLIREAASNHAKLIVLPEMFTICNLDTSGKLMAQETFRTGDVQQQFAKLAKELDIWLIAGTLPIATDDKQHYRSACLVFNNVGNIVARYDKIHLFDVSLQQNQQEFMESNTTAAGDQIVIIDTPIGKIGLAICYDLRFPELFRLMALQGAEIFIVPSAFTQTTGQSHWHLLTRARAVENFCYMIAANNSGNFPDGNMAFGHSLIIDPWGEVLAEQKDKHNAVIYADIDLEKVKSLRQQLPIFQHQKMQQLCKKYLRE